MTDYVKENYDEERESMDRLAELERKVMKNKDVNDRNMDQFMDDYLEDQTTADMIEREEMAMDFLTEDYLDGDYQGENEENYDDYN